MPKFSANLSMMFTDIPFLDRFAAARKSGFDAVEFLFPYVHSVDEIAAVLKDNQLEVSVFNLHPGDWDGGERGLAALPGREAESRASVAQALPYAQAAGATHLHAMAGMPGDAAPGAAAAAYLANIRHACEQFASAGLTVLIEPINLRDMPGYFLSTADHAVEVIEQIGAPNLKLLFDVYHHQIMRGDVCKSLERLMPHIGHIQIAGVPDRHEPDEGELDYRHVFACIDRLGYEGWIGCEYRPRGSTEAGLKWREALAPGS